MTPMHPYDRRSSRGSWRRRVVLLAACLTLLVVGLYWYAVASTTDRFWLGTVLALGPRWVLLVPVVLLLPWAAIWHRGAAIVLLLAGLIAAGPVMDFRLSSRALQRQPVTDLRIMTCNIGGQSELNRFVRCVRQYQPAIVACQEWPAGIAWPLAPGERWHVVQQGGLLVASRYEIGNVASRTSPTDTWRTVALACDLQTERGTLRLVCLHLLTPRSGLEAVMRDGLRGVPALDAVNAARRAESRLISDWSGKQQAALIAGDFNMVQASTFYANDWSAFDNAFSEAGWGYGPTKWTRTFGVRIDHVLVSSPWVCWHSWVGPDVGSDHRPLLADLGRLSM